MQLESIEMHVDWGGVTPMMSRQPPPQHLLPNVPPRLSYLASMQRVRSACVSRTRMNRVCVIVLTSLTSVLRWTMLIDLVAHCRSGRVSAFAVLLGTTNVGTTLLHEPVLTEKLIKIL